MNQKGVTLMEMLAVVIILGIVFTISFVVVDRLVDRNVDDAYTVSVASIEAAARTYCLDHQEELPTASTKEIYISLDTLVTTGYIDEVKNVKTEKKLKGKVKVTYVQEDTYEYKFQEG